MTEKNIFFFSRALKKNGWLALFIFTLISCSDGRVFEESVDLENHRWRLADSISQSFVITHPDKKYNVYTTLRYTVAYPYSRLFSTYSLTDSTRRIIAKKMITAYIFDQKTGEPLGKSGLRDIFRYSTPLLRNYYFPAAGKYTITLRHEMRSDTLEGIYSVGLRVEEVSTP